MAARLQREKEVLAREAREKVQREQQEKEHHDKEQKEKERREKEQREKDKKAKEAAEAERKERERVASEKKRQEAERRKRLETQLIGAGGAVGLGVLGFTKWQTILTVGAVLFRSVGGPSLVSGILRTPGYIFGRSVRAVEWDVAASPTMPNGCSHSFKLRAFTPVGMRIAIAKANRLSGPGEVKQISQWIQIGPNFYEPLRSVASLAMLPDPAWVVWSRQPRTGEHGIPRRGDEHKLSMAGRGLLEGMSKDEEITLMLRAISGAAALTRQRGRLVAPSSNPPAGSDSSARIGNIGSNSTTPATASVKVVASSSGQESSTDHLMKRHSAAANVGGTPTVQRSVSFGDELPPDKGYRGATHSLDRLLRHLSLPANFEPISEEEEQALVLAGCSETNSALLALFQAYATKDLATFLTYARAHMASQARS
ncbi:hypothetical protein WJX72_005108 [[Myrmecia] bisecta]|uniref:Uncharacterized protein n=1 Tax=[Myrmecia] bisecta TaxID=41462 RepID=A0AAW1QBK9_9CHLO